jgi:hypothetical protein
MNENFKNRFNALKLALNALLVYAVIVLSVASAFFIGIYYNKIIMKREDAKFKVTRVLKQNVSLAIDENNHLIVINNQTGDYTIYSDSVGKTIFKLYAKNVWGENNTITDKMN